MLRLATLDIDILIRDPTRELPYDLLSLRSAELNFFQQMGDTLLIIFRTMRPKGTSKGHLEVSTQNSTLENVALKGHYHHSPSKLL